MLRDETPGPVPGVFLGEPRAVGALGRPEGDDVMVVGIAHENAALAVSDDPCGLAHRDAKRVLADEIAIVEV